MKVTIVYDNILSSKKKGLTADWGFACLIQMDDHTLLFDTGADSDILLSNMAILGINPQIIDTIVISHEHWDHNGGLTGLLPHLHAVDLYRFDHDQSCETMNCIDSEKSCTITDDILTTGRLKGIPVDEQSLLLRSKTGWYVLAGCSHPGVGTILAAAQNQGDIRGIIGGLHGFDTFSLLEDLDMICPCHCTEHMKKIRRLYPKTVIVGGVGKYIKL